MERKYAVLAALLVVLALGLVILPKNKERKEVDPEILLQSIAEKSRYLSVDVVTHRIIESDPTLMLIDLRPAEEFKKFNLPGAVNIPADSLLTPSTGELFSMPGKDKVLYANSDLLAEKAWLICSRYSRSRVYIMKGGLNEWFNTFMMEQPVATTASSAELDLRNFRNAARQFFTGKGSTSEKPAAMQNKVAIPLTRKVPAASAGGGC